MTAPSDNFDFQNFYSATLTSDITAGDLTIPLDIAPTPTEGVLIIDPDAVAPEVIFYTSKGASSVTCPADGRGWDSSSATTHGQGTTVIMAPTAYAWRMLKQGSLFDSYRTGWTTLGYAPNTVTDNGNHSYDLVFSGVDLTGTVAPGDRLRSTRTVAAPTQCTSLNGSTQYYSKSSPAGMTFTDDFVVSAWIKLSSYQAGNIASRYNATSGWRFALESDGRLSIYGYNASGANFTGVTSSQSVPLGEWVHVAAQLDMSSSTVTGGTNNYVMFDGVDVPCVRSQGGTNPTALVQAGNLEIGSANAGTFFNGKIAQVAIYNAKVTQSVVRASKNQTLTGSETSLISAYTFNNSINDLSANANNLTANGSAVATNADSPYGGQANGTVSSTLDYAIIQKAVFSTNTTLTVHVPEGCTMPTSGGVSSMVYSLVRAPYNFPAQEGKWTLKSIYQQAATYASSSATTAYNTCNAALTLPVGEYQLSYRGQFYISKTSSGTTGQAFSLMSSTAASATPLNRQLTAETYVAASGSTTVDNISPHYAEAPYSQSAQATLYVNVWSELALSNIGWFANTTINNTSLIIKAKNAYL